MEAKRIDDHADIWKKLQGLKTENNPGKSVSSTSGRSPGLSVPIPCSVVPYCDEALKAVEDMGEEFEQVNVKF